MKNRVYKGVKRYWRRRGYRRLTTTTDEFRSKRRRWSWKIRMPPRLKIKLKFNPKKMIARLHDAYVRMMMRVASFPVVSGGALGGYGGGALGGYGGGGGGEFGMRAVKEYDEKKIIEMYKSIVARQLSALDGEVQQIACSK